MLVRERSQVTRVSVGATGAFGFVAGHLSGVVIFDPRTGRTGNGRIRTIGAVDGVVIDWVEVVAGDGAVVVLVGLDAGAAGWWVEWQPHTSAQSTMTSVALTARPPVQPAVAQFSSR